MDLTKIRGRGAARRGDRSVVWHLGDRLLLPTGEETSLDGDDFVWLAEPRIELTESATRAEIGEVRDAVMAYRWRSRTDGYCALGWLAASVAAGALEWRPHVLLSARAGSGKSWFLREVVGRVLGPLVTTIGDGTVASVARDNERGRAPDIG